MQSGRSNSGLRWCFGALLRATLTVENIGASHFMVLTAHQTQLNLVLYIFNMKRAATWARAHQGAHHIVGERIHCFAHAG